MPMPLGAEAAIIPDSPRSAPEIRALIGAFNRLTERIADLLRARMALVGGISHDLRTDVTRLRLRADLIPDAAERSKVVGDLDEMSRLLDDSFLAYRSGTPVHNEELVEVALLLAREVEDRARANKSVTICLLHGAKDAEVLGDAIALRRLFANLIDNAIAYGREARITADLCQDTVVVTIDDSGPGIREEDRAAMMELFVRQDASRSRRTGAPGLASPLLAPLPNRMAERCGSRTRHTADSAPWSICPSLRLCSRDEAKGRGASRGGVRICLRAECPSASQP